MGRDYGLHLPASVFKPELVDGLSQELIDNVMCLITTDNNSLTGTEGQLVVTEEVANNFFTAALTVNSTVGNRKIAWLFTDKNIHAVVDDSGTAEGGGASSLSDTDKSWSTDEWKHGLIVLLTGPGAGDIRQVGSNTSNQINSTTPFSATPTDATTYALYNNPIRQTETFRVSENNEDSIRARGDSAWVTGGGAGPGDKAIVFHCKDSTPNDIAGVRVTVYNEANTVKVAGPFTTDANGNTGTFLLNDLTYTLRLAKEGAVNEEQEKTISGDATIECTLTVDSPSVPSDPELCRVYFYPITLDGQDVEDLAAYISSKTILTKVNGEFIRHATQPFVYDAATTPDRYYFDAFRGSLVKVWSTDVGINKEFTVPDQTNYNLDDEIPGS